MFRKEASILGPVIIVIIIMNKMVVINICLTLNYLAATRNSKKETFRKEGRHRNLLLTCKRFCDLLFRMFSVSKIWICVTTFHKY